MWLLLVLLATVLQTSKQSCEVFKKSVTVYRIERVLYKYVGCVNISSNTDIRSEILSKMNSSTDYLMITNSSVPVLQQNVFKTLNLTNLSVEGGVQLIEEKTFEKANISTIILENNKINKIGSGSFNSSSIYVLSLKNNSMNQVTMSHFVGLDNLKKLNLQNNQILEILPNSFTSLVSLDELNLSFNRLSSIPASIFQPLRKMQTLFLNNNYIKSLNTDAFVTNSILQYLSLQNNYLSTLDATLYPLSIIYINAGNNNINSLNISNLINLNRMILDKNKISNTINAFENLPSLTYLHLNNNQLGVSIINQSFEHLKNLTVIEIDNNNLQKINFKSFQNLNQLAGISLAENNLTSIDFSDLKISIKHLNFSKNFISNMKNLSNLGDLKKLELSENNLQEVSYNMFKGLYNLQNLWLSHNSINKLDRGSFRDLRLLLEINLSYNDISNILSGIFNGLNSLTQLDISYNDIANFDEDVFHNMKTLRFLNIAYNNLSNVNIRKILSHTTWLRELNLNGNNWTCKALVNIVRDYKILSLTSGDFFNMSNVYGIPCNDSDDNDAHSNKASIYLPDIVKLMNIITQETKNISFKMTIANCIIILALILICCRYLYFKYYPRVISAKQFVYKKSGSEQEIQLI